MTIKKITVQQGQTLSQIAKANNTSVSELCKLNNIKNPNIIFTGQKIITGADTPKDQPQEKQLNINSMKFLQSMIKIYEHNGNQDLASDLKNKITKVYT